MSARRLALVAIVALIASGRLMGQATGATAPAEDPADEPEPGSQLAVSLLTVGPGDAVWELFGHNALRIRDRVAGSDDVVHWGLFSFRQADFAAQILPGVDQQNGELAGLALAMHAGLWVGLRSLRELPRSC